MWLLLCRGQLHGEGFVVRIYMNVYDREKNVQISVNVALAEVLRVSRTAEISLLISRLVGVARAPTANTRAESDVILEKYMACKLRT